MKLELEEIYKTYFQDVYYFVLAMSKDPHIAEEITQEIIRDAEFKYK